MTIFRQLITALVSVALVFPSVSEAKPIPANSATVTYDYDAFGVLLHSTGSTPNNYLYAGEQFDPDLGLYYNRARYLNFSTDRFWTIDIDDGADNHPLSLHKYLYSEDDAVDGSDPSGLQDNLAELGAELSVSNTLNAMAIPQRQAIQHFPTHARQVGASPIFAHDKTPGSLPNGYGGLICEKCYGAVRFYNYEVTDSNGQPFNGPITVDEFIDPLVSSEPVNASKGTASASTFSDTIYHTSETPVRYYYFKTEQIFTVNYQGQHYPLTTKVNQYIERLNGEWLISAVVVVP